MGHPDLGLLVNQLYWLTSRIFGRYLPPRFPDTLFFGLKKKGVWQATTAGKPSDRSPLGSVLRHCEKCQADRRRRNEKKRAKVATFWEIDDFHRKMPILADFRGSKKRPPGPEKLRGGGRKTNQTANPAALATPDVLGVLQMYDPAPPHGRKPPKVPGNHTGPLGA